MNVYFMVRRKKSTYFIDAQDNDCVLELKKKLAAIIRKQTGDIALYNVNEVADSKTTTVTPTDILSDESILCDVGFNSKTSTSYEPRTLAMALRLDGAEGFDQPDIQPLSPLPELPEVMKSGPVEEPKTSSPLTTFSKSKKTKIMNKEKLLAQEVESF